MTKKLLDLISKKFPLTALPVGEMSTLKANGMTFSIQAYTAKGLGHVSVMTAKGFFGLMKMDTLIINPLALDLPLYSYDRIYAMGNDTLIVELYDTFLQKTDMQALESVKIGYADLPERDPGEHWYDSIKLKESISKKGKKAHTARFDELTIAHLQAYLDTSVNGANAEQKREKASIYVNGLLEKGGPSTDVFKKSIGVEKTAALFQNVLFGTKA